jgi:hypothetical protein
MVIEEVLVVRKRPSVIGVIVAVAAALLLVAAPVAARNEATAHSCQHGGYLTLQRADGSTFASQSDCVSYGASGGMLYAPSLATSLNPVERLQVVTYTVQGFHASSTVTLTFVTQGGNSLNPQTLSTDATGTGTWTGYYDFVACPNAITVTATDASGVMASLIQTLLCAP